MKTITYGVSSVSLIALRTAGLWLAAAMCALLTLTPAQRAQADADITFHGTLLEAPPCMVNNNEPIVVDFGNEVMTTRIDGANYKKPVLFTVDCSEAISIAQKVRISGTTATFDSGVLAGDQGGFGFAFYNGNSPLLVDKWVNFNAPLVPSLYVVPVKQEGVTLNGGAFRTLASLVVEYQ